MSNKVIHALYNDDDILMDAVKKVKAAHHHIDEVFTPFPVHGLGQSYGTSTNKDCNHSFSLWIDRFIFRYLDDQLYDDSRLAPRYWRETEL